MKKAIVGKKIGMTQVFTRGRPSRAGHRGGSGPLHVVQKKTVETDGYEAVQVGFGDLRGEARQEAAQQALSSVTSRRRASLPPAICASSALTTCWLLKWATS